MYKSSHICKGSTRTVRAKNHEKAEKGKLVNQIWICYISKVYFLLHFELDHDLYLIFTCRVFGQGLDLRQRTFYVCRFNPFKYYMLCDKKHQDFVLLSHNKLWSHPIIILFNSERYINVLSVQHLIIFREGNAAGYAYEDDLGYQ